MRPAGSAGRVGARVLETRPLPQQLSANPQQTFPTDAVTRKEESGRRTPQESEGTTERKSERGLAEFFPQHCASPRALATGDGRFPRTSGPGSSEHKHRQTQATLPSPGVPPSGATPAAKQAPIARAPGTRILQPAEPAARWLHSQGVPAGAATLSGPAGTYLQGGVSRGDPPAANWRKAEQSFPAQHSAAASSGSCCAAAQLRHPDPPGTFTSCRELRESRKESGRRESHRLPSLTP